MAIKSLENILQPDPRFAALYVSDNGVFRRMTLADHYETIAKIRLTSTVPDDVVTAFDRSLNTTIYAFFDYSLFVVGEMLALGAFELALKHRLNGPGRASRGTLRNLVDRARKAGILPKIIPHSISVSDPIEALVELRNGLSHGTSDIHLPAMALDVIDACGSWTNYLFRE